MKFKASRKICHPNEQHQKPDVTDSEMALMQHIGRGDFLMESHSALGTHFNHNLEIGYDFKQNFYFTISQTQIELKYRWFKSTLDTAV